MRRAYLATEAHISRRHLRAFWQRLPALGAHVRLAHRIAAFHAPTSLHTDEPAEDERAADQQPEDGGVEERVDCEGDEHRVIRQDAAGEKAVL